MKSIADLIARIFIAAIFLHEAYDSIRYFKATKAAMTEYGLNWRQDLLLIGSIVFLILGGTLILIGYRASLGALLLILYWLPVTLIVHDFWTIPTSDPAHRINSIHFMKNIAIIGGLLMVYINGAGKYSVRRLFATIKVPGT